MALYNEVRPQTLSELKGQEDVVKILRKSVAGGTLPNAALFVGTRGTGKTTVARILAKMVNCESPLENGDPCCSCPICEAIRNGQSLDVIELDAASNNGVDDVRRIIELVQYKTVSKKKVVILDEVHMLSSGAFNALLKVLEEPPRDVLFILCTTEVHKVPATILSRCRKFQFRTLTLAEITSKLCGITEKRKVKAEDEALNLIAKAAKGSMRDAESIFESFLDLEEVTEAEVRKVLGFSSEERIIQILAAVAGRQPWTIRDALAESVDKGENLNRFIEDSIEVLVRMASIMLDGDLGKGSSDVSELVFQFEPEQVFDLIGVLRHVYESKPSNLEVSLLAALVGQSCAEDRIAALSDEIAKLKSGALTVPSREEAADTIDHSASASESNEEEEWERLTDTADFEDASDSPFPLAEESIMPEAPAAKPVEELKEAPAISKKALSSLVAAGFVVEGNDEASPGPSSKEEVPVTPVKEEAQKSLDNSMFEEFKALFHF